jgi:hypothetical protein
MQESKVLRDSQLASFAKIADFFLLVAEFVFAEIAEKRLLKAGFRAGKALAVVGDGTPLGEQRELLVSFRGSNKL